MKWLLGLLILSLSIAGCSPTDDDLIGRAQNCLDHASSAEAQSCVAPIEHITKASAQRVKCAAGFATENFGTGQRLVRAYSRLENPAFGTPGFLGLMTFYSQKTAEENRLFARRTDGFCQQTGVISYDLLGAIALSATTVSAVGGLQWSPGNPPSREQIQEALSALQATRHDPVTREALREVSVALLRIFIASCKLEGNVNKRLCAQVRAAVSGSSDKDNESPAERILDLWKK